MKKVVTASVVGRRNKQQILKDFIRPSPANTISSATVTTQGGFGGGNIPGCADGTIQGRTPCAELDIDLSGAAGAWPNNLGGAWKYYPNADTPSNLDPFRFWNTYLIPVFPFEETIADGDPLDYFEGVGSAVRKVHSSHSVQAEQEFPFAPMRLRYYGSNYRGGSVTLSGLSNYIQQKFPYETLTRFNYFKIGDSNRQSSITTGNGLYFSMDDPDLDTFNSGGVPLTTENGVVIEPLPFSGPDTLTVRRAGETSQIDVNDLVSCDNSNMIEGAHYYLRVRIESNSIDAKLWLATNEEPDSWSISESSFSASAADFLPGFGAGFWVGGYDCASPTWDEPCAPPPDDTEGAFFSRLLINPVSVAIGVGDEDEPCDPDISTSPGFYMDTLLKKSGYWIPATPNVSYYRQVYFDGIPVEEDTHYWLDGLKLYPNDNNIFSDTRATAQVVVE